MSGSEKADPKKLGKMKLNSGRSAFPRGGPRPISLLGGREARRGDDAALTRRSTSCRQRFIVDQARALRAWSNRMRCGPQTVGLVWLLASLFGGAGFSGVARASEAPATTKSIPEPELPPELDRAPPKIAIPQSPAQARAAAGVEPILPEMSDPEVGTPPLAPGATPDDIEDALEALPPVEGRHSALAAMPNWRASREALLAFYAGRAHIAIWTDATGFNSAGRAIIARLRRADEDGLDLSGLTIPEPKASIKDRALLAKAEVGLAETILAYAFQASGGRIDPLAFRR